MAGAGTSVTFSAKPHNCQASQSVHDVLGPWPWTFRHVLRFKIDVGRHTARFQHFPAAAILADLIQGALIVFMVQASIE